MPPESPMSVFSCLEGFCHAKKGHLLNDFLGSYKDHAGQILDEDVGSGDGNNDSYSIEDIDMPSKLEKEDSNKDE